jgi:hypothetical protein
MVGYMSEPAQECHRTCIITFWSCLHLTNFCVFRDSDNVFDKLVQGRSGSRNARLEIIEEPPYKQFDGF